MNESEAGQQRKRKAADKADQFWAKKPRKECEEPSSSTAVGKSEDSARAPMIQKRKVEEQTWHHRGKKTKAVVSTGTKRSGEDDEPNQAKKPNLRSQGEKTSRDEGGVDEELSYFEAVGVRQEVNLI